MKEVSKTEAEPINSYLIYFLISVVLGSLILLPILWHPIGRDQGHYCYVAWAWLKYKIPFFRSGNTYEIGIIFLTYLAFKIFGVSTFSLRLFDLIIQILNLGLIFTLANLLDEQKRNPLAGFISAGFYAFFYLGLGFLATAQRDGFVLPFLLLASLLFLKIHRGRMNYLGIWGVGILTGIAILLKPTFALSGVVFSIFYIWRAVRFKKNIGKILIEQALLLFSGLLPAVIAFIIYHLLGAPLSYWKEAWIYFSQIYPTAGRGVQDYFQLIKLWDYIIFQLLHKDQMLWLGLFFYFLFSFGSGQSRDSNLESQLILVAQFIICLISIFLQSKPDYPLQYHKIPALGFAAIFSGKFFGDLINQYFEGTSLRKRLSTCLGIAGLLFLQLLSSDIETLYCILNYYFRSLNYAYVNTYSGYYKTAEYIKTHTSPDQYIGATGFSQILFLSRRLAPTRYTFDTVMTSKAPGKPLHPYQEKWQEELLEDLKRAQPVYIIWKEDLSKIYGLKQFVKENYFPEARFGEITIYHKK